MNRLQHYMFRGSSTHWRDRCNAIISDHSYFKGRVCWWKTSSKCAEEVSCGKEGNLFVFTFSDPGRTLRNKVLMAEPLKMSTVRVYLALSFPLSIFIYKKERDYITGCLRQDEVVYFAYGGILLYTVSQKTSSYFPPLKQSTLQ